MMLNGAPAIVTNSSETLVFPRILLAEDNRVNQRVIQLMVQKLGFTVDTVDNGLDAVTAVQRVTYGVVLMDVAMPTMDGLEATRRIRALFGGRPRPYIIGVTASHDRAVGLAAGMDAYINKPLRLADLTDLLADALIVATQWQEDRHDTHRSPTTPYGGQP